MSAEATIKIAIQVRERGARNGRRVPLFGETGERGGRVTGGFGARPGTTFGDDGAAAMNLCGRNAIGKIDRRGGCTSQSIDRGRGGRGGRRGWILLRVRSKGGKRIHVRLVK